VNGTQGALWEEETRKRLSHGTLDLSSEEICNFLSEQNAGIAVYDDGNNS
jgi:hypothetical protein